MSPATSPQTLRHDALFYDTEEALASAAVSFVREGVESGETVLVSTSPLPVTRLLKAVFGTEPLVRFPTDAVYGTPVTALDQYQRILERVVTAGAPGVRAIGHVDLSGHRLPWQEWVRYEAAVNRYFSEYPLRTLCPYDLRAVGEEPLAGVRHAHPTRVESGRRVNEEEYVDPTALAARPEYASPQDPLERTAPTVELDRVTDLRSLRMDLYPALLSSSLPALKVDDYVKAVGEVAMNAVLHGEAPVLLRLWTAPDRVVCAVSDAGEGIRDPLLGYARQPRATRPPGMPVPGGMGVWAARQLCDMLDYSTEDGRFTVRLRALT